MEESIKGTATSLASIYPVEETQKAVKRVQETIYEKQKELDLVNSFGSDNTYLINHVQRLPDELFHNIMVPFGKAAFFPGRLIHTNEFYVLLGEGYYAERTSKQTIEILKRRGKVLDAHADSLKAMMLDLKAEARFFGATATESAEGFVEIRENYFEENPTGVTHDRAGSPNSGNQISSGESIKKVDDDDKEYVRIMSRLDELEKEERKAEGGIKSDEDEFVKEVIDIETDEDRNNQTNKSDEGSDTQADMECSRGMHQSDRKVQVDQKSIIPLQRSAKDESLNENMEKPNLIETNLVSNPGEKEVTPIIPSSYSKAFTGSIIEHTHALQFDPSVKASASSKSNESNPTKPVSRFKMRSGSGY